MAVSAPARLPQVHPDVWHGPLGPAVALGLVVLPFAAALVWAVTLGIPDERTAAVAIRETAAIVDDHAAAMVRIGERIAAAGRASSAADREVWIAYGEHMASDGRGLQTLGERLRATATIAQADPIHRGTVQVAMATRARWELLRADGRATAAHGQVMVEQARNVAATRPSGIVTDADVRELERASAGMVEAGERAVRAADMLLASVSQMQRWLGR